MNNKKNLKLAPDSGWAKALAVLLLLTVWQVCAMLLGQKLLLPSPLQVLGRLATVWREPGFFGAVGTSFARIALGFSAGLVTGGLLAVLAGRFRLAETLLWPFMITVKSVPVASFIILALVWLSSSRLSTFISFLMVLPVIYTNFLAGIKGRDPKLSEMSEVFRLPWPRKFLYLWLPEMKNSVMSGLSLSLGLAWKAGIAAEVIGLPGGTIGEALYESKAYLNTVDLFCWTLIIVLVSVAFEKAVLGLARLGYRRLEAL